MHVVEQARPDCKILPKYTTREARKNDDEGIITVDELPEECEYRYEQYGKWYGLSPRMLADYRKNGKIPVTIINNPEVLKQLRRKFGSSMKSYFVHRRKPNRGEFTEIYLRERGGVPDPDVIEKRYQAALEIYKMYPNEIMLFDNVIFNVGDGFDEVTEILNQIFENPVGPRNLQGNKIYVIAGGPGSGKKFLVQGAEDVGCLQVQKHADRQRNPNDGTEIICKGEPGYNLEKCKLRYKRFGTEYGIDTDRMWENLIIGDKPQILLCSDIDTLRELKREFGEAIVSIYVHSDMTPEEWAQRNTQQGNNLDYIENRMSGYDSAFENYAKYFSEYDKSFIYAGDKRELMKQFAGVLGIPCKSWERKKEEIVIG